MLHCMPGSRRLLSQVTMSASRRRRKSRDTADGTPQLVTKSSHCSAGRGRGGGDVGKQRSVDRTLDQPEKRGSSNTRSLSPSAQAHAHAHPLSARMASVICGKHPENKESTESRPLACTKKRERERGERESEASGNGLSRRSGADDTQTGWHALAAFQLQ